MLTVGQAKAAALSWTDSYCGKLPSYLGAFLAGSITSKSDLDALPVTSDVDVRVVLGMDIPDPILEPEHPLHQEKLGYRGVVIEPSFVDVKALEDPANILSDMHLAPPVAAGCVLRDPKGLIARAHSEVAAQYRRRQWIARRCDHAMAEALKYCDAADSRPPLPVYDARCWRISAVLVSALGASWIPTVAALEPLTSRRAFIVSERVLMRYGMTPRAALMADLVSSSAVTAAEARDLMAELEAAYNVAVKVGRTEFHCRCNVSAVSRAIALGGIRELLPAYPREAMFFMGFIRTIVQNVLVNDVSPKLREPYDKSYESLLTALGLHSQQQVTARLHMLREAARDLRQAADEILQRNELAVE